MMSSDEGKSHKLGQSWGESRLLRGLRKGDHQAFEQVNDQYRNRLFRSALSILRNAPDAEDAVQETLIRAFLKIHTFDGRSKISTWLTRILINCCLVQLRKGKKLSFLFLDEAEEGIPKWPDLLISDAPALDDALIVDQELSALRAVIRGLPVGLRSVLIARNEQNLTMGEIATGLSISLPATKSRALRARKLCAHNVQLLLSNRRFAISSLTNS